MSNINMQAVAALDELSDAELDQVLGAGVACSTRLPMSVT